MRNKSFATSMRSCEDPALSNDKFVRTRMLRNAATLIHMCLASGKWKLRSITLLLTAVSLAYARVATIDLGQLARLSDLIVVGEVAAIQKVGGVKVASVKTISFVKGVAECPIAFVAEPTWACDTSAAVVGERALLYLSPVPILKKRAMNGQNLSGLVSACKRKGVILYVLSHSGRGRIPLKFSGSKWIASVRQGSRTASQLNVNLTLPRSAPIQKAPNGSRFVDLNYLAEHSKAAAYPSKTRRGSP
ncbi:MAG: hypothetical protein ACR2HJ_01165 [Fimbriimonadales bacterium]